MIEFPTFNGVSLTSDNKQVVVAVNAQGEKKLRSFETKNKVIFWHFPFVRGLQYFACGAYGFLKSVLFCLDFMEKTRKKNKSVWEAVFASLGAIFACVLSVILFGYVPNEIGFVLVGAGGSFLFRNFIIACIKILLLYVFVGALRFIPHVNELFCFNFALISNISSRKNEKKEPNFLNFVVFVVILDFLVVTLCGMRFGFVLNLLLYITIFLCCVSCAYEILSVLTNNKVLSYICFVTQVLIVSKPSRTHTETVVVALTEMKGLEKGRDFMADENKKAFSVVYNEVKNKLSSAGINDKSDADWIIATSLGKNRGEIRLLSSVTDKQYADIMKATERRANGESVDNIFGFTEFFGLRFDVNKKVLTPRMETELLVEQVLKAQQNYKKCTILDLGTGSGAIAVALAKNCDAQITAVDISKVALATAESNAKKNGVKIEFVHSNLFENLKRKRKFDIIVSNPPYIPSADIEKLDKNVRTCDPILALDGGEDGLSFYRQIIFDARNRLTNKGKIFFEVGMGQAPSVRKLLRENGFGEIKTIKDYNKIERIVSGTVI